MNEDYTREFQPRNASITLSNIALLLNAPISDKARTVYLAIAANANSNGECFLTLEEIGDCCPRHGGSAQGTPMGKGGVSRCVKELENAHLLSRERRVLRLNQMGGLSVEQQKPPNKRETPDFPVNVVEGPGFVMLPNEQQKPPVSAANTDLFGKTIQTKRKLPTEQQKGEKRANKKGSLSNEQRKKPVEGINNNIYINNNINNKTNNTTTANTKNARPDQDDRYTIDDFTKQNYPGSPVPVRYVEIYFENFGKRHALPKFDVRAASLHFLDHWE
jgi:hypothetical protein